MHGQLAVETVEQHARARAIDSLEPRSNVNASSRHGRRLESEGDPARIEVDPTQDLGVGIVGIDHRHAARHDLAKELGLGPALLQEHFGREPERRGDIGHHRGMKGDPVKAMVREGLAGDLEDAPLAAALDHLGQQGRQTGRARHERPGLMIAWLASRDRAALPGAHTVPHGRWMETGADRAGRGPIAEAQ